MNMKPPRPGANCSNLKYSPRAALSWRWPRRRTTERYVPRGALTAAHLLVGLLRSACLTTTLSYTPTAILTRLKNSLVCGSFIRPEPGIPYQRKNYLFVLRSLNLRSVRAIARPAGLRQKQDQAHQSPADTIVSQPGSGIPVHPQMDQPLGQPTTKTPLDGLPPAPRCVAQHVH